MSSPARGAKVTKDRLSISGSPPYAKIFPCISYKIEIDAEYAIFEFITRTLCQLARIRRTPAGDDVRRVERIDECMHDDTVLKELLTL